MHDEKCTWQSDSSLCIGSAAANRSAHGLDFKVQVVLEIY